MLIRNKKIIVILLAILISITSVGDKAVFAFDKMSRLKEGEREILFETSFELDEVDKNFLASTVDKTKGNRNIYGLDMKSFIDKDINYTGINNNEEIEIGMTTKITKGSTGTWNQSSEKGWTGDRAMEIAGIHKGNGEAYSYNVIYKDLNIKVDKDTRLSYTIFPSMLDESNYDYTQMHISIDLEFTDGTYLSDLGAIDQYGTKLNPQSQGDSRILTTNQWNYISSKIGNIAKGKKIKNILVAYNNKENPKEVDAKFKTYNYIP